MLRSLVAAFVVVLSVAACKVDVPATVVISPTGPNFLSCSANLTSSPVTSGVAASILVQAQGGTAPYSLGGVNFGSNTQIIRTYENTGSVDIVIQDIVTISDSAGNSTSCLLVVNVRAATSGGTDLACSMSVSPASPTANVNTGILVTMSGGTGTRSVDQFFPGDSATLVSAMTPVSASTSQAVVKYSTTGSKNAIAVVKDGAGNTAICNKSFTVNPSASVSVVASPSSTVPAGQAITLVASGAGFSASTTYNFTTTNTNVQIVKSGNTAIVTNKDLVARSFDVLVSATDGSQTATVTASLGFTSPANVSCSLSHVAGTYKVGDEVTFNVSASNGAGLFVTFFSVEDAVIVGSVGTSTKVKFTSSGTKRVYAKAQTSPGGQQCNAGALLEDSIAISAATTNYTCSVVTAPNPSRTNEYFLAQVTSNLPNAASARVEAVESDFTIPYGYSNWVESGKNAYVWIGWAGTYQLTFTVVDPFTGYRATCSTQHAVRW